MFIAGLMVGRTPEYLGKKIQAAEMKLVVLYLIAMPLASLAFAAASVVLPSASSTIFNPGAHGLSEVLYNYASAANNNGSAFAGQGTGTDWYTITMGLAMLMGRFFLIIPALAIGGSLVRKQKVPATAGTFPTDSPLFGGLVVGAIVIIAGLTFFPALALGPIVEQLYATERGQLDDHDHVPRTGPDRRADARSERPPKVRRRPSGARSLFDGAIVRRAVARRVRQARPADAGPATR